MENKIKTLKNNLSESLRINRIAKKMTQEDLAEKSGVSLRSIQNFEMGGNVNLNTLLSIITALDEGDKIIESIKVPTLYSLDAIDDFLNQRTTTNRYKSRKTGNV